jgi:hypothetical protein
MPYYCSVWRYRLKDLPSKKPSLTFPPTAALWCSHCAAPLKRPSIEVKDHGPGIPDYAQDKVFEKFY